MPNTEESINETGGIPEIEMQVEVYGMVSYPTDKTLSIDGMAADAKATGEAISTVNGDLADLAATVAGISEWTGEDIPLNTSEEAPTIAEAIGDVASVTYPVGTVYMTISNDPPAFIGTWVEIALTATWAQLKSGTRGYAEMAEGQTGGDVHFWLRTE